MTGGRPRACLGQLALHRVLGHGRHERRRHAVRLGRGGEAACTEQGERATRVGQVAEQTLVVPRAVGREGADVDRDELIEASDRLQKMIERENDEREKRLKQLEATATQLRGATDKLIEAADSSNVARRLEAVKDAEEQAAKARAEIEAKKAANDDKKPAADTPTAQPAATENDTPAADTPSRRPKRTGPTP